MNLSELRAAVVADLNRNDVTDAKVDEWINMATARLGRLVRLPNMDTGTILTVASDGTVTIPADYVELRALYSGETQLVPLPFHKFLLATSLTDTEYFCRMGTKFHFRGVPAEDEEIGIWYYRAPLALSADDDEDIIHEVAPDAIKFGALVEAAVYFLDNRKDAFTAEFDTRAQELIAYASRLEMTEGPMYVASAFEEPF
jgi:hypothetical protein